MTLNYGRPTPPEDFIIGALMRLGRPVVPEKDELAELPCYQVTSLPGTSNRYMLCPIVSVHSFGRTRDEADKAAWDADELLLSLTPGDSITLATGVVVPGAWVDPKQTPTFVEYRDPDIKRYVGRYTPNLRFLPTK